MSSSAKRPCACLELVLNDLRTPGCHRRSTTFTLASALLDDVEVVVGVPRFRRSSSASTSIVMNLHLVASSAPLDDCRYSSVARRSNLPCRNRRIHVVEGCRTCGGGGTVKWRYVFKSSLHTIGLLVAGRLSELSVPSLSAEEAPYVAA